MREWERERVRYGEQWGSGERSEQGGRSWGEGMERVEAGGRRVGGGGGVWHDGLAVADGAVVRPVNLHPVLVILSLRPHIRERDVHRWS